MSMQCWEVTFGSMRSGRYELTDMYVIAPDAVSACAVADTYNGGEIHSITRKGLWVGTHEAPPAQEKT